MIEVPRIIRLACAATALAIVSAVPASAHPRDVVRDDPAIVADRLHHMGFVEWRRVRWDNGGYWKIDDARRANGHVYDLEIEAGSFDLIRLKRERS